MFIFNYALQPFKAYRAIWVRRSNFCHHASPRETHHAAEGVTVGEKSQGILPKCRFTRYIQGCFTYRKATTWDLRLYYPSEGRRAEDFFARKIPTVSAGCETAILGTKGQHATSRPPKPLTVKVKPVFKVLKKKTRPLPATQYHILSVTLCSFGVKQAVLLRGKPAGRKRDILIIYMKILPIAILHALTHFKVSYLTK
jgi:hypothetical protein